MPTRKQPVEQSVEQTKKLPIVDGVPRETDTFWRSNEEPPLCTLSGHKLLRSSWMNKSLAFTHHERQMLNIHGLMPIGVFSMEQQLDCCAQQFAALESNYQKYIFLATLEDTNRKLFYNFLLKDPDTNMSVYKSSEIPFWVQNFSLLHLYQRGMYVCITDRGHVYDVLRNWPMRSRVRYLLVTNGESVMNMGDHGVNGAAGVFHRVYQNVVHGGIDPDNCLPVMLDVGTDNEALLEDPLYVGLRRRRVSGPEFNDFMDEFTLAVLRLFGPRTIIVVKNFNTKTARYLVERYAKRQCYIDLSQQIRGACGLAGLLAALRITELKFTAYKILFYGSGNFNIGMAHMCLAYLKRLGLDESSAWQRIWFCDDKGLIVEPRCGAKVPEDLLYFSHHHKPIGSLLEVIEQIKPNVLVGCSPQPNVFTKEIIKAMEQNAQTPIIYAISSPSNQTSAEDAFIYTKGRCIFVSSNQLPPVKYANKWYQPGYCNSSYLLCGLTLGVMLSGMTSVPVEMFLVAAERMANLVWPTDLAMRNVFPPQRKLKCVNLEIAAAVFSYAYRRRLATMWPEPINTKDYIKSRLFNPDYTQVMQRYHCQTVQNIGTIESQKLYTQT